MKEIEECLDSVDGVVPLGLLSSFAFMSVFMWDEIPLLCCPQTA